MKTTLTTITLLLASSSALAQPISETDREVIASARQLATTQQKTKKTDTKKSEELIVKLTLLKKAQEQVVGSRKGDITSGKASFKEPSEAAREIGFHEMHLQGRIVEEKTKDGKVKVQVLWDKATWQNKETHLSPPFKSGFIAGRTVKQGDAFKAIGEGTSLLAAWKRLQKEKKEESKEQQIAESTQSKVTSSGGSGGSNYTSGSGTKQSSAKQTPAVQGVFADVPNYEETAEGCPIVPDVTQLVAIQQTKVLEDGREVSGCSHSETRYPIVRVYGSCPVYTDETTLKIHDQYQLAYTDPSSGASIIVEECQPDLGLFEKAFATSDNCRLRHDFETGMTYVQTREVVDVHGELIEQSSCADSEVSYAHVETADGCHIVVDTEQGVANQQTRIVFNQDGVDVQARECRDSNITYPLVATAEGCSMVHDYQLGQSVQQVRYTYTSESGVIEAVACADDESQVYAHVITTEGCDMIIDNNVMIPQNRIYIEVGGVTVYLNECTPDTNSSVPVFAETCDPAYTHDFLVGQSYLNTRYYYDDNGNNVYITECTASTTSFAHEIDTEQCSMAHDDTTKQSQLMGSYYIIDEGHRVDISSCLPIGDPIPYVQVNNHWRATGTVSDVPLDPGNNPVVAINIYGSDAHIDDQYVQQGWQYNDPNNQFGRRGLCDPYGSCFDRSTFSESNFQVYSYQYCFEQTAPVPWVTDGGQTLDRDYSDSTPTWQGVYLLPINNFCNEGQASYIDKSCDEVPEGSYAWDAYQYCTIPTCNVTTLEKNPTWERGDQSLYYDTTTILESKLVCGSGTVLDGEEG